MRSVSEIVESLIAEEEQGSIGFDGTNSVFVELGSNYKVWRRKYGPDSDFPKGTLDAITAYLQQIHAPAWMLKYAAKLPSDHKFRESPK